MWNVDTGFWTAVSAIGTVLGAAMTCFASCIALYQANASTRPRLRSFVTFKLNEDGIKGRRFSATKGSISITNIGLIPISVVRIEIRDNYSWTVRGTHLSWVFKEFCIEQAPGLISKVIDPGQSYLSNDFSFVFCAAPRATFSSVPLRHFAGMIRCRLFGPVTVKVIASDGKGYKVMIAKESKANLDRAIILSSQMGEEGLFTTDNP